ncbi:MAG: helix-turn-helix transcriptional regulator [Lentisphaerae bacterium]|nr:helix-turn-helix transcriptional regulator [Lentisphaerota bacterium]
MKYMKYDTSFSLRISPAPTIPVPYGVRSAGRYRLWKNFHQPVRKKLNFLELFWVVSGQFIIRQEHGENITLNAKEVGFLLQGDTHEYWTTEETDVCWLTIDGSNCSRLAADYRLSHKPFTAGRCPVEKFARLKAEVADFSVAGQYAALSTALNIIHMALSGVCIDKNISYLVNRFKQLAQQRYRDRDCGVGTLAEELHIHRATLHRVFSETSGISPSEFIADLRLQEALRMLCKGSTIAQTALACGYANANYMSKVIRKKTGFSPGEYRNMTSSRLQFFPESNLEN